MARYKELKVLLGGDINEEAGEYINAKLGSSADQILDVLGSENFCTAPHWSPYGKVTE